MQCVLGYKYGCIAYVTYWGYVYLANEAINSPLKAL